MIRLGVNVDHVATIRQARGTAYPDPCAAAMEAIAGGAEQITIHLREDRRHIQDADVTRMREALTVPLNLEMSISSEIVSIACRVKPVTATLVPERRAELTTEGGLDVASSIAAVRAAVKKLADAGIAVSLFVDPDARQIEAAKEAGAQIVELHTGAFCDETEEGRAAEELKRLMKAAVAARDLDFKVCAGHGINYDNTSRLVRALPEVTEYNIGHAIVSRAFFVGMKEAVREMKQMLTEV